MLRIFGISTGILCMMLSFSSSGATSKSASKAKVKAAKSRSVIKAPRVTFEKPIGGWKVSPFLGMNLSTLNFDDEEFPATVDEKSLSPGFAPGFRLEYDGVRWGMETGASYAMNRMQFNLLVPGVGGVVEWDQSLDYVQIPLHFKYYIIRNYKGSFHLKAGGIGGMLVTANTSLSQAVPSAVDTIFTANNEDGDNLEKFQTLDLALSIGAGGTTRVMSNVSVLLDLGFTHSLLDISAIPSNRALQMAFSAALGIKVDI